MISSGNKEKNVESRPTMTFRQKCAQTPALAHSSELSLVSAFPEASKKREHIISAPSSFAVSRSDLTDAPRVMLNWRSCAQGCNAANIPQSRWQKPEVSKRSTAAGTSLRILSAMSDACLASVLFNLLQLSSKALSSGISRRRPQEGQNRSPSEKGVWHSEQQASGCGGSATSFFMTDRIPGAPRTMFRKSSAAILPFCATW
mmetsp:Transcript_109808/g.321544  ORF Transcript_109808/g.321544 Transcript_109808/m.321544 type:complete len:202 (-) Transcript_109808:95-700(-)